MNKYFEFKDLQQYYLAKTIKRKHWTTMTYRVPKSEEFFEKAVIRTLQKYDIEFLPGNNHQMLRIILKVPAVNKGTEENEDWEYDLKTFEYPYSDAVLKCCLDVFLDFDTIAATNKKRAEFAMSGLDEKDIAPMLDDYAKRHGVISLNHDYPRFTWLVCYEYCRGDRNKDGADKSIITFCINCVRGEKYIYDIYITNTYEEMVDRFNKSLSDIEIDARLQEIQGWIRRINGTLHEFCYNGSKELQKAIVDKIELPSCLYDASLIIMYLDSILSSLRYHSKYEVIIGRYREKMMDAYKVCCGKHFNKAERNQAAKKFINEVLKLRRETYSFLLDKDNEDHLTVYTKLEDLWMVLEKNCNRCQPHSLQMLPARDFSDEWINKCEECISNQLQILYYPEYVCMETYRIQYLLDVFLHHKNYITPERMRLKLLSNYDMANKHSITINRDALPRTIILEPGKRLNKKDRTKEYQPLFFKMHSFTEGDKMRITLPEQVKYVSDKYNICISNVCRGQTVKSTNIPHFSRAFLREISHIKRYRVKLKPVPAPRINGPYVTISDVCKRLEKLVYEL